MLSALAGSTSVSRQLSRRSAFHLRVGKLVLPHNKWVIGGRADGFGRAAEWHSFSMEGYSSILRGVKIILILSTAMLSTGCENSGDHNVSVSLAVKDTLTLEAPSNHTLEGPSDLMEVSSSPNETYWVVYDSFTKRFLMFDSLGEFIRVIGHPSIDSSGYFGCSSFEVTGSQVIICDYAKARIMWYDTSGALERTIPCEPHNWLDISSGANGDIYAFSPVQMSKLPTLFVYDPHGGLKFSGIYPDAIVQDSSWSFVPILPTFAMDRSGYLYFSNCLFYNIHKASPAGKVEKTFDNRSESLYHQIPAIPYFHTPTMPKIRAVFMSLHSQVDRLTVLHGLLFVSMMNVKGDSVEQRWLDIYSLGGRLESSISFNRNVRLMGSSKESLVFMDLNPRFLTQRTMTIIKFGLIKKEKSQ